MLVERKKEDRGMGYHSARLNFTNLLYKGQMLWPTAYDTKRAIHIHQQNCSHFTSTRNQKVCPTGSYEQLLPCTLYAMRQKDQRKYTGTKAAHKMMMKLTLMVSNIQFFIDTGWVSIKTILPSFPSDFSTVCSRVLNCNQ